MGVRETRRVDEVLVIGSNVSNVTEGCVGWGRGKLGKSPLGRETRRLNTLRIMGPRAYVDLGSHQPYHRTYPKHEAGVFFFFLS